MRTHTHDTPPRSQLRHFGWLLALLAALTAHRLGAGRATVAADALAAVVFAVGTVWPQTLRGPFRIASAVTAPVGWVLSRLLLALVYYLLLTPLALVLRVFRSDPLQCRFDPQASSYWRPRAAAPDRRRYLRQF